MRWRLADRTLDLPQPLAAGIVNVTVDSMFEGARSGTPEQAVRDGQALVDAGFEMLDLGAVAARSGPPVAVEDEAAALVPAIEGLAGCGVPISADTFSVEVARRALAAGASAVNDIGRPLHGVVAAAGILSPVGSPGHYPAEEFLDTLKVNLYGTWLAVEACLPALRATGDGAIVTFSGGGATAPLPRVHAYAASKAGIVRLTENLAPELAVFLLSGDARAISGKLISAEWDDWRDAEFRARLAADPDLATLRRIDDDLYRRVR